MVTGSIINPNSVGQTHQGQSPGNSTQSSTSNSSDLTEGLKQLSEALGSMREGEKTAPPRNTKTEIPKGAKKKDIAKALVEERQQNAKEAEEAKKKGPDLAKVLVALVKILVAMLKGKGSEQPANSNNPQQPNAPIGGGLSNNGGLPPIGGGLSNNGGLPPIGGGLNGGGLPPIGGGPTGNNQLPGLNPGGAGSQLPGLNPGGGSQLPGLNPGGGIGNRLPQSV